eukprot:TRINITY_DN6365_c0_g1_i1.p1 TRINITY_DN6365_c0_g1~~TRINITY_DN6365_c0_g1_i1.p1  ORF type:complete len:625 (-),score=136.46 TRINITY_DN6365_c0_g1_i1:33-1796(-)
MTASEAFVETLIDRKVTNVFGIVGSAFMDALDLFPTAGIRFIPTAHEQGAAHMADGYSRVSNHHGVCIGQNGPGITNFVTGIAAAKWAHSPVVAITPECGTLTKGLGGFQEVDQMPIFSSITTDQYHVNHPHRMAELTGRAFDRAMQERGPVQLNIPRDYFYGETKYTIPKEVVINRGPGSMEDLQEAADLIADAKNPVILAGGGVVIGDAIEEVTKLAEYLSAPVAVTYLHNDSFPSNHRLMCGPLGYFGSQAAMNTIKDADLVLVLGSRLGPFGTLPQYGEEYWPNNAKIIQVECNHRKIGLVKPVNVGIHGDVKEASAALHRILTTKDIYCTQESRKNHRMNKLMEAKNIWERKLNSFTDQEPHSKIGKIKPRKALSELQKALPDDVIVSTDIGNTCSTANSYLNFNRPKSFLAAMTFGNCGYALPAAIGAKVAAPERIVVAYVGEGAWGMSFNEILTCVRENIPVTAVVFNNRQWGAEKKNQVLWFGDRYVGSNLDNPSFSEIARSMGAVGILVQKESDVGDAMREAVRLQREGKTTVIEIMQSRELGDPFRRDAMKLPKRHLVKYQNTNQNYESETGQPVDL